MPLKCHRYATFASYFMLRYKTAMSMFIVNMGFVQLLMRPGALVNIPYTLPTYDPEQI